VYDRFLLLILVAYFCLDCDYFDTSCRQIEIDSKFLETQHIMDYSLLLGVHYRAPQHLRTGVSFHRSLAADGLAILSEEGNQCVLSNKLLHLFYAYKLLLSSKV